MLMVKLKYLSIGLRKGARALESAVVAEPGTSAAVLAALRNLLPDTPLNLGDIMPREVIRLSQQHALYLAEAAKYRSFAEHTPANVTATDAVLANGYEMLARSFAQLGPDLGSVDQTTG
jgi:hypothetical protein